MDHWMCHLQMDVEDLWQGKKNKIRNHVEDEFNDFIVITGAKFQYQVLRAWYVYVIDSCLIVGNEPMYRQVKSHGRLIFVIQNENWRISCHESIRNSCVFSWFGPSGSPLSELVLVCSGKLKSHVTSDESLESDSGLIHIKVCIFNRICISSSN